MFDEDFEEIEDETETKPLDSPKKVEPPPKPEPPKPAEVPSRRINTEVNQKAITVKSIKQLKEDLGPLTEEVKVDMEETMNELKMISKKSRDSFLSLMMMKVAATDVEPRRRKRSQGQNSNE